MVTNSMQTAQWPRLFLWIVLAIGVGVFAVLGSNRSITAADRALNDTETIDDASARVPIDVDTLSGSIWWLQSGSGPAGDLIPGDGFSITIRFGDDTFGGRAACNSYNGSYSIDGSTITLGPTERTLITCGHGHEPEVAFYAALADVDVINLVGGTNPLDDNMTLSGIASELIFVRRKPVRIGAILDQIWVLQESTFNDDDAAPIGEPATLRIDSDGSFTGTTGCRTLTGHYLISGSSILFNEMAADGNCPTTLSDQDGRVVSVLGDGFTVAIHGSALVVSAGNQRLRYRETNEDEVSWLSATSALTDAEILDGIEWIFVRGESPDGPIVDPQSIDSTSSITLTFSDDQYSGNAVCNAYGGEADLDGLPRFTYDELKGDRLSPFTLGVPEGEEESCGDELDEIAAAYRNALPLMSTGGFYSAGQGLYMYSFGGDGASNLRFERAQ